MKTYELKFMQGDKQVVLQINNREWLRQILDQLTPEQLAGASLYKRTTEVVMGSVIWTFEKQRIKQNRK